MTFFETLCMLSAAHCTWAAAEASRHCEIWLYFFSFIAGIALATENAHSLFYNQQSDQLLCYIFVYKSWIQHYLDFWNNLIRRRKSIFRLPFVNSCLKNLFPDEIWEGIVQYLATLLWSIRSSTYTESWIQLNCSVLSFLTR